MDNEQTDVIFRRWKKRPRTIIALFPDIPGSAGMILSYEHTGQHGGAGYAGVIAQTIPAAITEADVADLARELKGVGYNLKIKQRRG